MKMYFLVASPSLVMIAIGLFGRLEVGLLFKDQRTTVIVHFLCYYSRTTTVVELYYNINITTDCSTDSR